MKLHNRLAWILGAVAGALLLLLAAVVLWSSTSGRRQSFERTLRREAITKANLLLNAGVDTALLQRIYRNNRETLDEVEVAVYDKSHRLIYHDAVDIDVVKETTPMLDSIFRQGSIRMRIGGVEAIGLRYEHDGNSYAVTAAAYDREGWAKLRRLYFTFGIALAALILALALVSRALARRALNPLTDMLRQIDRIQPQQLHLRLPVTPANDELAGLAVRFNGLLDRLEAAFESQKQFTAQVAHELRTPLTTVITRLQVAMQSMPADDEAEHLLRQTTTDLQRLSHLLQGLLDLSRAGYDSSQWQQEAVRVDELLLDAREECLKLPGNRQIQLHWENDDEETEPPLVKGNRYLLQRAVANLMDNACKYSPDQTAHVSILQLSGEVIVTVANRGDGFDAADWDKLQEPFNRGISKSATEGWGIGLALVRRVADTHGGTLRLDEAGQGLTRISLVLPAAL